MQRLSRTQGGVGRQAAPGVVGLSPASLEGPQSTKSPLFPAEKALPETSPNYMGHTANGEVLNQGLGIP